MTVVIYTRNRACEPIPKERQKPILEQLYQRFEYVLTIISSQGWFIKQLRLFEITL